MFRGVKEWESYLGEQVKTLRLRQNIAQEELAARTGLGIATISRLESGKGSTLGTLIAVLQVLHQENWLEQLAPASLVSPIQIKQLGKPRQRVRLKSTANQARSEGESKHDEL